MIQQLEIDRDNCLALLDLMDRGAVDESIIAREQFETRLLKVYDQLLQARMDQNRLIREALGTKWKPFKIWGESDEGDE